MNIELRAIDEFNKNDVEALEVSDDQKQYIASNRDSMETSQKDEHREAARPFAIYAGEKMVGFAMFAFDIASSDPDDKYWLWRFMIDKNSQGKGYGAAALEKIIDYFKSQGADHILLSTKASNTAALSLYRKYRFAETGEMNDGEIILRLKL